MLSEMERPAASSAAVLILKPELSLADAFACDAPTLPKFL